MNALLFELSEVHSLREKNKRLQRELDEAKNDFRALQTALVGNTGLSAILEATRLRALDPLPVSEK